MQNNWNYIGSEIRVGLRIEFDRTCGMVAVNNGQTYMTKARNAYTSSLYRMSTHSNVTLAWYSEASGFEQGPGEGL
jgi:hypothetical protein